MFASLSIRPTFVRGGWSIMLPRRQKNNDLLSSCNWLLSSKCNQIFCSNMISLLLPRAVALIHPLFHRFEINIFSLGTSSRDSVFRKFAAFVLIVAILMLGDTERFLSPQLNEPFQWRLDCSLKQVLYILFAAPFFHNWRKHDSVTHVGQCYTKVIKKKIIFPPRVC